MVELERNKAQMDLLADLEVIVCMKGAMRDQRYIILLLFLGGIRIQYRDNVIFNYDSNKDIKVERDSVEPH